MFLAERLSSKFHICPGSFASRPNVHFSDNLSAADIINGCSENEECGVRSAECGVRSAECGVRSAECGVRSAECGVRSLKKILNKIQKEIKKKIEIKEFKSQLKE